MNKNRLEAFSDGVLAIIITIMILELKIPQGDELKDIYSLLPKFLSYVVSFVYVAIYWNNHHYLIHTVQKLSAGILWANLNLLFWLSLLPFATAWAGENNFTQYPVFLYGAILLLCAISYTILTRAIVSLHGPHSVLAKAIGKDIKGKLSILFYFIGMIVAFYQPLLSCLLYVLVAILWLIPDMRIKNAYEKI